jgi:toxin YoeB
VKLIFSEHDWDACLSWQRTDRKILERVNKLIKEIQRSLFEGTGKPKPMKHGLSGYWPRRISDEHRMVYKIENDSLLIAQLKYHYWPDLLLLTIPNSDARTDLHEMPTHVVHDRCIFRVRAKERSPKLTMPSWQVWSCHQYPSKEP